MSEPIVVSWSELDAGRQCPHKHELAYKQRWTPPSASRPLEIGKLGHSVLEAHFRSLQSGSSLGQAKQDALEVAHASGSDYIQTILWIYERFVERYGASREWKIHGVEQELRLPLDARFVLKVKLDLLIEDLRRGSMHILDWKFSSRLLSDRELAFDDQFGLYEAVMNRAGYRILSSLHGLCRTPQRSVSARGDPPLDEWFALTPLYRTEEEQRRILVEALNDFHRLHGYGPNEAPRHPDPDRCKWRCSFTFPCLHGRKYGPDRERELLEAHMFEMQQERH